MRSVPGSHRRNASAEYRTAGTAECHAPRGDRIRLGPHLRPQPACPPRTRPHCASAGRSTRSCVPAPPGSDAESVELGLALDTGIVKPFRNQGKLDRPPDGSPVQTRRSPAPQRVCRIGCAEWPAAAQPADLAGTTRRPPSMVARRHGFRLGGVLSSPALPTPIQPWPVTSTSATSAAARVRATTRRIKTPSAIGGARRAASHSAGLHAERLAALLRTHAAPRAS